MSKFSSMEGDIKRRFEAHTPQIRYTVGNDEIYEGRQNAGDSRERKADTARMTDITPEELRNTLTALEERMDRRISQMIDTNAREQAAYRREQEARDKLYSERFEAMHKRIEDRDTVIDAKLDAMSSSVLRMSEKVDGFEKQLDGKLAEVKSSNRNAAWAMLAIAAATVVGIWGVNSTIIGSVTGFFDAGKASVETQQGIEKLVQASKLQSEETFKLLQKIQVQQQSAVKDPAQKAAPAK
ncbi:hypothetical protein [Pseudomonas sp. SK]|uniref:hypothetical protein n=1 Tax=Pseudomonas sp. SK TaxID=2729423 RepID=UPI00211405C1|nr:hypothetical protein [Pseudomonas sp. SK]